MKKDRSYREVLLERLADSVEVEHYLNVAMEDSCESFLKALRNVAQARQMTKVAKDAGVQRETLYRSFSEQGNPTFATLSSVLSALGMRLLVAADGKAGALGGDSAEVEVHRSRV